MTDHAVCSDPGSQLPLLCRFAGPASCSWIARTITGETIALKMRTSSMSPE
jgi:hypothetical protein